MSDINAWLADYYGTGAEKTASGDEVELWNLFKAAAAEDGIDADALSDEEVDALSSHYLSDDDESGEEAEAEGEYPPNWEDDEIDAFEASDDEAEKQAFAQFKEAEWLGQVMAHSFEAEKQAMRPALPPPARGAVTLSRLKELATGHGAAAKRTAKKLQAKGLNMTGAEKKQIQLERGAMTRDAKGNVHRVGTRGHKRTQEAGTRVRHSDLITSRAKQRKSIARGERLKGYGKRVGAIGAVGAAGYGATKLAASEEILKLAEERAMDFIEQGVFEGYDDDNLIDGLAAEMIENSE